MCFLVLLYIMFIIFTISMYRNFIADAVVNKSTYIHTFILNVFIP